MSAPGEDRVLFRRLYIAIALAVAFFLGDRFALERWTDVLVTGLGLAMIGAVVAVYRWAGLGRAAGPPRW